MKQSVRLGPIAPMQVVASGKKLSTFATSDLFTMPRHMTRPRSEGGPSESKVSRTPDRIPSHAMRRSASTTGSRVPSRLASCKFTPRSGEITVKLRSPLSRLRHSGGKKEARVDCKAPHRMHTIGSPYVACMGLGKALSGSSERLLEPFIIATPFTTLPASLTASYSSWSIRRRAFSPFGNKARPVPAFCFSAVALSYTETSSPLRWRTTAVAKPQIPAPTIATFMRFSRDCPSNWASIFTIFDPACLRVNTGRTRPGKGVLCVPLCPAGVQLVLETALKRWEMVGTSIGLV
mmetsp:Transcript_14975/g.25369  ORF Transcript_14975/g.25369 Transcript_14975/m.25369 type:complete len:292 (+) Transcript_14975:693-1568(+)